MNLFKFMVKFSIVILLLSSFGAVSTCRASDDDLDGAISRSGMSFTPQWTPDGETIIVSRSEKLLSIDASTGQVEVISQQTGSPRDIFQLDYSPSISPDGTRIAFTTHRFETDGYYSWDIAMLEFDESGELRLRRQLGPLSLALKDGGTIQLTRSTAEDTNPIWSPDGSRIAFLSDRVETRPGSDRLYVMSADGSDVVSVAPDIAIPPRPFAWSPDGKKLAFTSFPENKQIRDGVAYYNFSFYIARADGSGVERVYEGFERRIRTYPLLAWSPDGSQLAIAIAKRGVFVAETTRQTPPRLIRDLGNNTPYGLFWNADGGEVLYYSDGTLRGYNVSGSLWGVTPDGRNTRMIWAPEDFVTPNRPSGMSMSPDGSQVAAYSVDYGTYGIAITLIGLDGSSVNLVEESDWPDLSELWTIY